MRQRESSGRRRLGNLAWWVAVAAPFALVGGTFVALTRAQQGALRDWLLSALVLCPLILCIFPLYLLMLALGLVALPKAAAMRRKQLRMIRERGLALQGHIRDWSGQLPAPKPEGESRNQILLVEDEERDGSNAG